MKEKILLGYEIGSGDKVSIKPSHLIVTGMTHLSGKTTCILGLIKRSGKKAIIFKTKRGEKAITEGTIIPPFFRERFDWEEAASLLEASRKEKLKFERSWIIRYSKNANSILEFKKNIDNALANEKIRELDRSVLITLQAYLDKILPELQYAPFSKTLDLVDGINVIDLERYKEETQILIIKSVLDAVLNEQKDVICIVPEAWKFIPQDYSNPCKRKVEEFIRQGATNGNYIWIDSQDLRGVDKLILRQVSTWIMGLQMQKDEVENILKQMPLLKRQKPDPSEIMTLRIGHFFYCSPEETKKIYAQPSWLDDKTAKDIAMGKKKVEEVIDIDVVLPGVKSVERQGIKTASDGLPLMKDDMTTYIDKMILEEKGKISKELTELRHDFFEKIQDLSDSIGRLSSDIIALKMQNVKIDEEALIGRILQKFPLVKNASQGLANPNSLIEEILRQLKDMGISGGNIYEVAPLEKIKKGILNSAKKKILSDISELSADHHKIIKYVESAGKGVNQTELISKCFFFSATSGSTRQRIGGLCKELENRHILKRDKNNIMYPFLKDRIKELMEGHGASEQEIEQIYSHILVELIK